MNKKNLKRNKTLSNIALVVAFIAMAGIAMSPNVGVTGIILILGVSALLLIGKGIVDVRKE